MGGTARLIDNGILQKTSGTGNRDARYFGRHYSVKMAYWLHLMIVQSDRTTAKHDLMDMTVELRLMRILNQIPMSDHGQSLSKEAYFSFFYTEVVLNSHNAKSCQSIMFGSDSV